MSSSAPITRTLSEFAAALTFETLPPALVSQAKLCLIDTLGCGLYGSTLPWVRIVRETALELGRADVVLWGTDESTSAASAAMVNATAVHSFELDDLHPKSIVHPGSVVVSAALATAALRPGANGRDLVTAMVAGYEVAARVGMSVGAAHLLQGWHPTGTHGALGAAAAAATMLRLSPEEYLHALGTAGSHSSGLMAAQFSSMVKRLHAGHAAHSGVLSALLARRGFLGIPDLLENGYGGYFSTFSPTSDPDLVTDGLGERWEFLNVGFKPYSTNGSCHPTIDALLAMRASERLTLAEVDRVDIRCSTATYKHVGWRYEPATVTTAQMNLPYIASVVLADGDAFVDQFTELRIADPALVAFSRRVHVEPDAEIDAGGDTARHATYVDVTMRDGRTLSDFRLRARGSAHTPLSAADVEGKYAKLAVKAIPSETAHRVLDLVANIEHLDDLGVLSRLLTASP